MKKRRILALLGAAWMGLSLALPVFAKQVNTETKEQEKRYGDTYVGDEDYGEPIGHMGMGDPFWSEQPFDSYWTDRGRSNYAGHDRSGMWLMTNYYYSGEGHSVAVDDPRFKTASYLGIRTVLGCRVYTENEWNLEKVSEKTDGTVHEVVYVGEVYTGDTIDTICTDYNIGTAFAINRYDHYQASNNDPSRPAEAFNAPTEYSCFNSNVRAVQRNGVWSDDAEDFIWEQNPKADANGEYFTGDAAMCGWIYTVQPGDEVIYADCQARLRYKNEYNGVEYDAITIRYRFKFVVMDSGADVTLPLNNQTSGIGETNPGGSTQPTTPQEPDDEDSWWDDLFGGDDGDTGSSGYLPSEPSKPESGLPEGETISEKGAAIIGTAAGAGIIGSAIGGMAGGGTEAPPAPAQPEAAGPDPDELRRRQEEERRRQEEERRRQEEEQKRLEEKRKRDEDLKRLREEYAEQKRQLKELEQKIIEDARKKAEEQKKYIDKLYKKYGVDPDQENAKKILRNTIKKEQIKNANDAAAELAKDAELAVWEQLATDISNGADISLELAASVTGETGQAVLASYYTLKGTASRTAEAIARIAYNGKSYKDYSLGDYARDAWDLTHSAVQGTAEGLSKAGQAVISYNDPNAKVKAALQIGGEAAKEMWDTARKGGDLVDIMKAGAKGTTKGAINATISYTLDKTVGKLAGKGEAFKQSDFSKTLSNYGGATGKITNKITSGDAVGGGANTAVSMITEKTGMNDAIDKFFGSPTAHADAAAQTAKRISDAASGIR
ncbi:MAG: hypothetical protein II768_05490 [Clostridia bacterium]|nr:hypothetical protein [Clostridia bacterium]